MTATDPDVRASPQPPHDHVAEQYVLSLAIQHAAALAELRAKLGREAFYLPAHQAILDAACAVADRGEPVEPWPVNDELARRGELSRVGETYLIELVGMETAPASLGHYVGKITSTALQRRALETLGSAGQRLTCPLDADDLVTVLGDVRATLAELDSGFVEGSQSAAEERFPSIDWHAAFATDFTAIDWLPGRFVERGQQASLVGDGKVGKSLFAQEWAWRCCAGRAFLGDSAQAPLVVLYLDRENALRDIMLRLRGFGAHPDELADRFVYKLFPAFQGGLDASALAAAELLAIVDAVAPDIVILDTVSRFISGKENDSDTWLGLYSRIHAPLKARGIAGVRLDHMGKDSERGSRGSSAKSQDVDHVWEMSAGPDTRDHSGGCETVITPIRMRRTHTRTGLGEDLFTITRRGTKGPNGMWLPARTGHALTDNHGAADGHIQPFVDKLIAAGAPMLGRAKLKAWAVAAGIDLPAKTDVLADIAAAYKRQAEAT